MQCFNIENQAFYSIFGSSRNILRLKYRVILPCSAQLSTRTLLNFPKVLTPTLISSQVKAQGSFQWFLILQCRSDIPHISIMFQALDLEDTFTLPLIHRYTKKIHQKNAVGMWDLARGRRVVGARCIWSTVTKVANCKLKCCRRCGPENGVCLRCYKAMPTLKCIITESGNFMQKNC